MKNQNMNKIFISEKKKKWLKMRTHVVKHITFGNNYLRHMTRGSTRESTSDGYT